MTTIKQPNNISLRVCTYLSGKIIPLEFTQVLDIPKIIVESWPLLPTYTNKNKQTHHPLSKQ